MAMGNCRRCLRKLLCCSHDACKAGAHQGLQIPPSGPLQSPSTAHALLPPVNPQGPVGLQQPLEELIKKLDLQTEVVSSRVVVISGCAGIDKTTLANALMASLAEELIYYNCIKVEINEDPLQNDFTDLEEWIWNSSSLLTPKEPAFIFVDSALRSNDLEVLLLKNLLSHPRDFVPFPALPMGSRILVTTRNPSVTHLFEGYNIPCHFHAVNRLAPEDALKILCEDPTHLDQIRNHEEMITEIAGGIPLALKIVGAYLRKQKYKVKNCSRILETLEHQGDLSESLVHFVYNDFGALYSGSIFRHLLLFQWLASSLGGVYPRSRGS